jgi:MoxR-like ATPase
LGYPSEEEELQMLQRNQDGSIFEDLKPCISLDEVKELQHLPHKVKVAPALQQYILDLVRASRNHEDISLGVSPRGSVILQKASQALAFILGREYALPDDVKFLAPHVLCHRLIPRGGRNPKTIVERLLRSVPIP